MSELEKFSTCDLLKTFDELGAHLSKSAPDKMKEIITKYGGADMATNKVAKEAKDYDPNEKTPKTTVEETKKPAETSESQEADAKIGKDGGMPPMAGNGDDMSPGTQADVLSQILEAIQDLKSMLAQVAGGNGNGGQEAPAEEVQMSAQPQVEKEAPMPTAPASEKQIASIVVKAMEDKFKEMGFVKTEKPKEDSGHPIAKATANPSMDEIHKMSWSDVHALNDKRRPPNFYEMIYGHSMD